MFVLVISIQLLILTLGGSFALSLSSLVPSTWAPAVFGAILALVLIICSLHRIIGLGEYDSENSLHTGIACIVGSLFFAVGVSGCLIASLTTEVSTWAPGGWIIALGWLGSIYGIYGDADHKN